MAISPITRRILAVNMLALLILAAGLLYLVEYRKGLIASELASLKGQARLFAAALGESAVSYGESDARQIAVQQLVQSAVTRVIQRMVETTGARARLFDSSGVMLADSRLLMRGPGSIQVEELPPPEPVEEKIKEEDGAISELLEIYDRLAMRLTGGEKPLLYSERAVQKATDYREALAALTGEETEQVRIDRHGGMVLITAVPVQRYKQVLGALMLSKSGADIEAALYEVRIDILAVFAVALGVTILLSIYLAGTISRPLHKLAVAAERIRHSHNRQDTIPHMEERDDEIGDLSESLRDMTEALWQRMDAIERFAADVAHEIKNPLTSLQSAVETAIKIEDPASQRKLMAIIADDVRRLDRLISDISDASRLDAELSRDESGPVDLGDLLATLADVLGRDGRPNITLASPSGVTVRGLEGRLSQVFRNLIDNAVSFSPPGGAIAVTVASDADWVTVTIDDDGSGLAGGKEEAIFERFYTERPAGEVFGGHSGLGLSISKQIVEAIGGVIRAENRKDPEGRTIGTRLIVSLPAL